MEQRTSGDNLLQRLRRDLVDASLADGGWPYYGGRARRLEPTCWALLALSANTASADEAERRTRSWAFVRGLQRADGFLAEPAIPGPNYAWNGLALLASTTGVAERAGAASWIDYLVAALLAVKGIALESNIPVRQNSRLQAWSWTEGTFSWIEPTAYCLLALKKIGASSPAAAARVTEAEALILDRVCDTGGWNYGNSQVLSQDLRPYVSTTALALLAMQNRRSHAAVARSLEWLEVHATTERSAMALSLAAICLHAFGRPTEAPRALLAEQHAKTRFLENAHLTAMAIYALSLPRHGARAFVVA